MARPPGPSQRVGGPGAGAERHGDIPPESVSSRFPSQRTLLPPGSGLRRRWEGAELPGSTPPVAEVDPSRLQPGGGGCQSRPSRWPDRPGRSCAFPALTSHESALPWTPGMRGSVAVRLGLVDGLGVGREQPQPKCPGGWAPGEEHQGLVVADGGPRRHRVCEMSRGAGTTLPGEGAAALSAPLRPVRRRHMWAGGWAWEAAYGTCGTAG